MIDAHLGTIGVWLALVASITGVFVIAVGLFTHRHDVEGAPPVARRGPGPGDGRWLATV